MKTAHEASAVDRLSTHEELHQVLALLNDPAARVATEMASGSEDANLREALSSLWQDPEEEDLETAQDDKYRWEEPSDEGRVN